MNSLWEVSNIMARYLASQIKVGKLTYESVIEKFPQYKEQIDTFLEK